MEAVQYNGHNDAEIEAMCPGTRDPVDTKANLIVITQEGERLLNLTDWVVKYSTEVVVIVPAAVFDTFIKVAGYEPIPQEN